jgi:hypothetical protein
MSLARMQALEQEKRAIGDSWIAAHKLNEQNGTRYGRVRCRRRNVRSNVSPNRKRFPDDMLVRV